MFNFLKYVLLAGLFTGWGSSPALNFGEKLHVTFAKGEEKT
jgi:hypothetical protein